ncbi:peptidoglycan-binding protein [Streptomonospora sp. PA3]|uniref:peptidoglycan-binding protein n=1 Tax=Streptomonospora sp. PA3 TaxID=2607326 RepID=UPI0012DDB0D6|nr:peptidoglycan-binding domain-containing protein [Streptomonospora sp. PA3]MUL40998.1 peptidoglycan-binding protein [Streptomonospora sp. PA3]
MVPTALQLHRRRRQAAGRISAGSAIGRFGPRRLLSAVLPALQAAIDARGLVPEPDPGRVRAMLIEIGELDPAAPPQERRRALAAFQRANGLPDDGVADGRTVSMLSRAWRECRELRETGIGDC